MAKKIEIPKEIELMHNALFSKKEELKMIPDLKVKSILIQNEIIEKGNKENKKTMNRANLIAFGMFLIALYSLFYNNSNNENIEKQISTLKTNDSLRFEKQEPQLKRLNQKYETVERQVHYLIQKNKTDSLNTLNKK